MWACYFALENVWVRMVPLDQRYREFPVPAGVITWVGRRALVVVSLIFIGLWLVYCFRNRLWNTGFRQRAFLVTMTAGCSWTIFVILRFQGFEPTWYQLQPLIDSPASRPIIGHRILFVWLAQGIHILRPSMGHIMVFMGSQIAAIVFATYMAGRWAAVFVGDRLSFLGQILLVLFLTPTISYYTFYDIGIVGFYCAAFLSLYHRRYWLFVVTVGLATLNHENALLLIPVALFACYGDLPVRRLLLFSGAAFGVHVGIRAALLILMPMPKVGDLATWTNPIDLAKLPMVMLVSMGLLAFRWACVFLGFPSAPPFVRKLAILYPLLIITTTVFGQYHETRQFDAGIPVDIAFVLCYLAGRSAPIPTDSLGTTVAAV